MEILPKFKADRGERAERPKARSMLRTAAGARIAKQEGEVRRPEIGMREWLCADLMNS